MAAEILAEAGSEWAVEHLRGCPDCAYTLGRLRAEPAPGPDLELRLLRTFRRWRDGGA
jgi:hypothetical protein